MLLKKSDLAHLQLATGDGSASDPADNQNVFVVTTRYWNGSDYTGGRNENGVEYAIANAQLPPVKKSSAEAPGTAIGDPLPPPPVPIPAPLPGAGDGTVVSLVVRGLDQSYWVKEIAAAAAKTASGEVLVFVHGYNNKFEVSVATAAHIQRKLKCVVVLISWNSQGNLEGYLYDEASVFWSSCAIDKAKVLDALLDAKLSLSFMTHSMGVRLGIELLLSDVATLSVAERRFNKLLICSPDQDRDGCVIIGATLSTCAKEGQTFLFVSSHDEALPKSQELHGAPRWGQIGAGETPPETPGVNVVNDTVMDPRPGHTICLDAVNTFATGAPLPPGFSQELQRDGNSKYWIISQDDAAA